MGLKWISPESQPVNSSKPLFLIYPLRADEAFSWSQYVAMAPVLLSPKGREPHPDELKGMIAAVLNLLEDQHILHGEPLPLLDLLAERV